MSSVARKIPEALHEELFARSMELNPKTGLGYADKELAAWLREAHGITCAHDTVTNVLRPYRKAAREARLERLRARASEDLPGHLATHANLMEQLARDARTAKTVAGRVKAVGEFRKGIDTLVRAASGHEAEVKIGGTAQGLAEFLSAAFGDPTAEPLEE